MRRTALITGASSGIGAATALALAGNWDLVLVARRRARLDELVARIAAAGGRAWAVDADLIKPEEAQRVVIAAVGCAGGLDALINNAGLFTAAPVDAIDAAHVATMFPLNLRAPMLLAAAAIPHLAVRGGAIINVTSVAADATFAGCAAYAATKAGLEAWSRVAREELRSRRIRVGVIAPGATDSEVWPAETTFDRARMCRAEDIAAAIRLMLEAPTTASIDRLVVTPPGGAF
ncbi:MAG: SDR family NAD(P)-dependent oxidoreductase [Planctomycetes bacterium]|jgi:NADP-dependent 3-hydroxy acid dehydrogenase YdfG|nr:SDR family NAD(P)-dependent oxidoreductase [Planctomycetota bacterium]